MKFIPTTHEGIPQGDVISRFLKPGEFYFGESNCQLHTILGSCIAITLWHPILRIGGMCHYILPYDRRSKQTTNARNKLDGKYSDGAMALFEKEAHAHATQLTEYQAKIFGGSNMLPNSTLPELEMIGLRNIQAAQKHMQEKGVPFSGADVGETGHRRIVFDIETGHVWVKHEPLQKIIP